MVLWGVVDAIYGNTNHNDVHGFSCHFSCSSRSSAFVLIYFTCTYAPVRQFRRGKVLSNAGTDKTQINGVRSRKAFPRSTKRAVEVLGRLRAEQVVSHRLLDCLILDLDVVVALLI